MMDERRAFRLRVHERNIDRYQRLLKTKLSEAEVEYLEKRLSEERLAVATLRAADTAAHIDDWANSPGLQPPK